MHYSDLAPFVDAPFYFWAKEQNGTYLFANQRMEEYAGQSVVGKTDFDISPEQIAKSLQSNDARVFQAGAPHTFYEEVVDPERGKVTLSVCKYPGELDGKPCVFGVSFLVQE